MAGNSVCYCSNLAIRLSSLLHFSCLASLDIADPRLAT